MRFGVPRETQRHEHRVGLTPFGVSRLVELGHEVFIEKHAGKDSHFSDEEYIAAGGTIVYQAEEVYRRAKILCRVGPLAAADVNLVQPETIVCAFHHLAVTPKDVVSRLLLRKATLIGLEIIEDDAGYRPVLTAMSEIAGHLAVHTGAHLLGHESGGRGIVLGGLPGVTPATIVILGAGTVGLTAARLALSCGAHVILIDASHAKLREALNSGCQHAVTALPFPQNLQRYTAIADVLIGSVLIPGGRAPFLVTEEMVKKMKPGSVVLDVSIDQGGCVATSRPTSLDYPTYQVYDVTHYCVPNMTANVPRDASRAITSASLNFLTRFAEEGLEPALRDEPGLRAGVYTYQGQLVNAPSANAFGMQAQALDALLG